MGGVEMSPWATTIPALEQIVVLSHSANEGQSAKTQVTFGACDDLVEH